MTGEKATAVDPTSALTGAGQLTSVGDQMLSKWHGLRDRIDSLNGRKPWGNDDVGKQFNKNYLQDGDKSPAHNVLDVGETLVVALSKLGPQITEGVKGTEDLDQLISAWFGKH
ncbi:MAG TPA: hypothetical protein VGJ07_22635 [Rugosimonospora sp.]|jgi:hypothetical protein